MAKDFDFEGYMREMIAMSKTAGSEMRSWKKGIREQDQAHQEKLATARNATDIETAKIGQQGKLAEVAELARQNPQASITAVAGTITDPIAKTTAAEKLAKEEQPRLDKEAARPLIGQLRKGLEANAIFEKARGKTIFGGPARPIQGIVNRALKQKGLSQADLLTPEQQTAGTEKLRQLNEGVRLRTRGEALLKEERAKNLAASESAVPTSAVSMRPVEIKPSAVATPVAPSVDEEMANLRKNFKKNNPNFKGY